MTYKQVLEYQLKTMAEMLSRTWIGFRSDRERFLFEYFNLKSVIAPDRYIWSTKQTRYY